MLSDIRVLLFMTITLVIMNMLFINYDSSLCPQTEAQSRPYGEFNETGETTYEDIRAQECEGIPNWIKLIVNAPFLTGIGLISKKYVLI